MRQIRMYWIQSTVEISGETVVVIGDLFALLPNFQMRG